MEKAGGGDYIDLRHSIGISLQFQSLFEDDPKMNSCSDDVKMIFRLFPRKFNLLLLPALVWLIACTVCGDIPAVFAQQAAHADSTTTSGAVRSVDDLILHDPQRNKDLHVRITHPAMRDELPVIVFSHGAGGSKDSYRYLANEWASHGYLVIQPTHADSIGKPESVRAGLKKLIAVIRALPADYSGWNNRFRDISFIIDSLADVEKATGVKADRNRIGVGGHSYGAFTSVIIGGGKVPARAEKYVSSSSDKRAKAILPISPQPARKREKDFGFDDDTAWSKIDIPAMYMTGTYDQTGWAKAGDRKEAFTGSPPPNKYFVVIQGANHMTFAGRTGAASSRRMAGGIASGISRRFGPPEQGDHDQMEQAIKSASTTFWDAHLKDDGKALAALKDNALQWPGNLVEIQSK